MDAPLDRTKAEQFLGQVVSDVGTALLGALSFIGDRLDLFRTLADAGPVTIEALATRTGFSARYLREWLNAMTAAGYVLYRPESGHYVLPPEHATVLADPDSPFFVGGFLEMVVPSVSQATKLLSAFRSGGGVPQREYPPEMFEAIERGTAPWYKHHLLQDWIPTMPQVGSALARGGRAADVGCGSGQAALALARGFPEACVVGYDVHEGSIARARANAEAAGVAGRVTFEVADATRLPERHFDFISTFDVVHDSVDPVGLMAGIRRALVPGGTYLLLEMRCSPRVEENINPLGKFLYSVSTLYCMTTSLAEGGAGIGAAMGEPKTRELADQAGFRHFRKLPIDDPFSVLYALQP